MVFIRTKILINSIGIIRDKGGLIFFCPRKSKCNTSQFQSFVNANYDIITRLVETMGILSFTKCCIQYAKQ